MSAQWLMRTLDFRGKNLTKVEYQKQLPRARLDVDGAMAAVTPIINTVRDGTEISVRDLGERFDGVRPTSIRVPHEVIEKSLAELPSEIRSALEESIRRVKIVHTAQVRLESTVIVVDGGSVIERWIPVDRVGLYVPGGNAVYPSSLVMNVVPAQIAKVKSIAIASPPQKNNSGWPHPTILATAALLGVDEVYAMGGAQAIASFAYGIASDDRSKMICDPVDLVTGPGNIYVAAAKRALRGKIGIDAEAGPTEIAVIADESAIATEVASDLISQAEHDVIAAAILITDSAKLADDVQIELLKRIANTKHKSRILEALTGVQSAIVLVSSIDQAIDVANAYAAEHLELQFVGAAQKATQIRNAGAIFIGRFSPVSLGDYSAGSNHVLPTGGCACHSSGLSVQTFLRGVHVIEYSEAAFTAIAQNVITLANAEDLPAHGEAIRARLETL
ncbi:MAG: histidinol dehydrogenase [Streptomycetaceae bacterium]|jgi:histidinol dehydrogenase|nr:histidinol dehydrogenase [Actinomycetota bacterium]TRZ85997.1 MAG: histidinol dehydrogenase [Streptomycetaceae bacterium]